MNDYSILAVFKNIDGLQPKIYLLRLFVRKAAQATRNVESNEELLRKEKLTAVGKASSVVMDDLRALIKNIALITGMKRDKEGHGGIISAKNDCVTIFTMHCKISLT